MDVGVRRRSLRIQKLVKKIRNNDDRGDREEVMLVPNICTCCQEEERVVKKKKISKTNNNLKISNEIIEVKELMFVTADIENEVKIGSEPPVENGLESVGKGVKSAEKSDYAKVRETIRAFNKHYLHFVQEEELRVKNIESSKNKDDFVFHVTGVDVGHQFYSRAEMVVVGLHSHWLNGNDFMGAKFKKMAEYKNYTFPIAVSIVLGNDLLGNKCQIADQEMKRGNLALKSNIEQNVPVRVIRGLKCPSSYCGKVYTYDGLYNVVRYWVEKGVSGFTIYKYRLKRLEGKPVLTTNQVQFTRAQAPKCADDIRGLVCKDISGGQENIPIPATNLVNDPPVAPTGLTYITTAQVSASVKIPKNACGWWQIDRSEGYVVYECGPHCGCGPGCVNKTSQRGLKYRLEVYRTPKKGWGVRSWDFIPSGAFVCEYIGVIKRTDERRRGDVSISPSAFLDKADDEVDYCIDAGTTGNVTRYINHSCAPNLFVQYVLSDHHDVKLARIVLFVAYNIPLQELSYDYGYAVDSVVDKMERSNIWRAMWCTRL
ncbi:hypothetical protein MKX01_019046 [Papaver californicum]|nr:hypothetical protein MKX01_019046 [Papaver californicum]